MPEGRWDHDGYYQLYSDDNDHLRINDDYLFGRQDVLSRSCIHISNLVPSVISDDIKVLSFVLLCENCHIFWCDVC